MVAMGTYFAEKMDDGFFMAKDSNNAINERMRAKVQRVLNEFDKKQDKWAEDTIEVSTLRFNSLTNDVLEQGYYHFRCIRHMANLEALVIATEAVLLTITLAFYEFTPSYT